MEQGKQVWYLEKENRYYWIKPLSKKLFTYTKIPDNNLEEILHAMFICATHKQQTGMSEINNTFNQYCTQKRKEELKRYTNYYNR